MSASNLKTLNQAYNDAAYELMEAGAAADRDGINTAYAEHYLTSDHRRAKKIQRYLDAKKAVLDIGKMIDAATK